MRRTLRFARWPVLTLLPAVLIAAVLAGNAASHDTDPEANEPTAAGPTVVVASGTSLKGRPWKLQTYPSNRGLCLDVVMGALPGSQIDEDPGTGSAGGCGPPPGDLTASRIDDYEADEAYVYGTTDSTITRVGVCRPTADFGWQCDDVKTLAGTDKAINFYLGLVPVVAPPPDPEDLEIPTPPNAGGGFLKVMGYDASGNVVAIVTV